METKTELVKAVLQVMEEVEGIEKSMQVGNGTMSYKGVPDQEVKKIVGKAMRKAGLILLPIGVQPKTTIERWEETSAYNGVPQVKVKQNVFTEVQTRYKLMHTSGEYEILEGFGQGTDSQDKSAGKATTYALKYTLLYTFLIPTGKIDDADTEHSDDKAVPQNTTEKAKPTLPWLNKSDAPSFAKVVEAMKGGYTIAQIRTKWSVSKVTEKELEEAVNQTT